jgi:hypothetical protein
MAPRTGERTRRSASGEGLAIATPAIGTRATPSASPVASQTLPVIRAATPETAPPELASETGAAIDGTAFTSPTYGFSTRVGRTLAGDGGGGRGRAGRARALQRGQHRAR